MWKNIRFSFFLKNGINWGLSHEKKPENSSTEYSTMAANIRWKHSRIDRFDDLQTNHFFFVYEMKLIPEKIFFLQKKNESHHHYYHQYRLELLIIKNKLK